MGFVQQASFDFFINLAYFSVGMSVKFKMGITYLYTISTSMNPILNLICIYGAKPHVGGTDGGFQQASFDLLLILYIFPGMDLCCKIQNVYMSFNMPQTGEKCICSVHSKNTAYRYTASTLLIATLQIHSRFLVGFIMPMQGLFQAHLLGHSH